MLMPVSYIVRTTMSNEMVQDQTADGVARQPQVMLHGNLGSIFLLVDAQARQLSHGSSCHRTCCADLRLTAAFGAREGGVVLDQIAEDAGDAEGSGDLIVGEAVFVLHV